MTFCFTRVSLRLNNLDGPDLRVYTYENYLKHYAMFIKSIKTSNS